MVKIGKWYNLANGKIWKNGKTLHNMFHFEERTLKKIFLDLDTVANPLRRVTTPAW
jgi:hypothetical protein